QLSIRYGLHAFNVTLTTARIAGLEAVALGAECLRRGRARMVLAGALEGRAPEALQGYFSPPIAEGAACLMVLEPLSAALDRGARGRAPRPERPLRRVLDRLAHDAGPGLLPIGAGCRAGDGGQPAGTCRAQRLAEGRGLRGDEHGQPASVVLHPRGVERHGRSLRATTPRRRHERLRPPSRSLFGPAAPGPVGGRPERRRDPFASRQRQRGAE